MKTYNWDRDNEPQNKSTEQRDKCKTRLQETDTSVLIKKYVAQRIQRRRRKKKKSEEEEESEEEDKEEDKDKEIRDVIIE